jgi:hypothetical protein
MARRSAKGNGDGQVNETSEQLNPVEPVKSEQIEFGLSSQHPGIDEEMLEKLGQFNYSQPNLVRWMITDCYQPLN